MKSKRLLRIVSLTLLGATVLSSAPTIANAAWKKNNTGWWYTEGSSWATGWRNISGTWYYFDANGYMKTGWIKNNGTWYYLKSSGAMATGWVKDNGIWYFLSPSGAMKTGWLNDRGTWYYLGGSGAMKTGWLKDNGTWYFLKQSGAMASNEMIENGGEKYYLSNSGAMVTGWKKINSDTYYFSQSGAAATGQYKIEADLYYFNVDSAKLLINGTENGITTDKDGKIISISDEDPQIYGLKKIDGKTYYFENGKKVTGFESIRDRQGTFRKFYFDKDGVMQTGWLTIEGKKYYANSYGVLQKGASKVDDELYYFNSSAELVTTPGLYAFSGEYYPYKVYVQEDGTLYTGWKTVEGKTYYFESEGPSVEGLIGINGRHYYFNNDFELQCNINHYGISTNESGEVTKFNDASIKEDILKNDSKAIKELKDKYGEISIDYKSFGDLDYLAKYDRIRNTDRHEVNKFDGGQDAFLFEAKAKVNGKSRVVKEYYVSSLEGNIYIREEADREGDSVLSGEKLSQIKDNKVIKSYEIEQICK